MSGIGTGTALAIGMGAAAAGGIASAAIGSSAAKSAANTQATAAEKNAQMQGALGQESLTAEEQQNQQNQANLQPWLQSGTNANSTLQYLLGMGGESPGGGGVTTGPGQTLSIPGVDGSVNIPGVTTTTGTAATNLGAYGSLMKGYGGGEFQAPTAEQARQTPGYQFGLQQGEGALQAGAAANGSLLTGGTQSALNKYGQDYADTNYNNVYNQALQTYGTNYNTWANQQASEYNKLASMSGLGQTTAQNLNTEGLASTGQIANTLSNTGQQMSNQNMNAANATASGYINSANAINGGISSGSNSLMQMMLMKSLFGGGGSGNSGSGTDNPFDVNGNYGGGSMDYYGG